MATTVRIPMAILTVQPDSGNCFYETKTGTNVDYSYFGYVDAGVGSSTWWGLVPSNVAATEAWNIELYHHNNGGTNGNVVIDVLAIAGSHSRPIDLAMTRISSAAVIAANSSSLRLFSAVTGATLDAVIALSSNNYLMVQVDRFGNHTSDSISAQWNLESVILRIDVA